MAVDRLGPGGDPVVEHGIAGIRTRLGIDDPHPQLLRQPLLHRFINAALQHRSFPDMAEELGENPRQFRLVVVIGSHIEDDRIIGGVTHETLVALVRFIDEIFSASGPVVPGEAPSPEPLDQRPVQAARIGAEIGQRFREVGGDGALAAAAGHRDGTAEIRFANHPFKQFGTVEPGNSLPRDEIGIILLDRRGVNQEIRTGSANARTILRIDLDSLKLQRVDNPAVFRAVGAAVAAGNQISVVGTHRGQTAHADAADADEVQVSHRFPPVNAV